MGLDFVWLDFEHRGTSPWDASEFEALTRAADVSDIELLVRIPAADPALVRRVLDSGVRNLLIPRVDDAEEIRTAVEASRFTYVDSPGQRGYARSRSGNYGATPDYTDTEDSEVCVGTMIEKESALNDLDEILAVEDLGFAFVGAMDLSVQLGHPGNPSHPDVQEAIRTIEIKTADAGIPLGGISHEFEGATELVENGYRIVRIGGEFGAAQEAIGQRLARLHDARTP
jgi:2-dehydro-3-deoxyglucarate aldolase